MNLELQSCDSRADSIVPFGRPSIHEDYRTLMSMHHRN